MLQSLWINYTKRNRGNVHPSRTHLCVCVCVKLTLTLTLTLTHVIAVIELLTVLAEDVHQRPGLQLTWKQSSLPSRHHTQGVPTAPGQRSPIERSLHLYSHTSGMTECISGCVHRLTQRGVVPANLLKNDTESSQQWLALKSANLNIFIGGRWCR